jgi:hypothetical protein
VWLDELNLFRVVSLSPWTAFSHPLSWRVRIGAATMRDGSCDHCIAGKLELGGGLTKEILGRTACFLMVDTEAALSPKLIRSFVKLGVGPSLGVRVPFTRTTIALLSAGYRFQFLTPAARALSYSAEMRWGIGRALSLDLRAGRNFDAWEGAAGVYYYF